MPGPWITNSDLRRAFADSMKLDPASLSGTWDEIINRCNTSAASAIASALQGRGYTSAQIDAWDRRVEFNYDLGLYWCLVRGSGLGTLNESIIQNLDRRKELAEVPVTVNGVIILPESGVDPNDAINGGGSVSGGQFLQGQWRFNRTARF